VSRKAIETYIKNDMKLHAVRDEDISGYLAYIGLSGKQEIEFSDFRKM
jgi:hypothetical protein